METRRELLDAIRAVKSCKKISCGDTFEGLDIALNVLREVLSGIDNRAIVCNNISNRYIFHTDELTPFQEGYNTAIRDALDILERTNDYE